MISVQNLTRKYGDFTAVRSVSFEIPRGQIVGLLGHNGAGKTTTLKMITGYLEPTEGRVLIGGIDIQQDRLRVQEKIGYLSEQSSLYPEMSVWQYLDYVAQLRGIPEDRRMQAVRDAVVATDLQPKVGAPIHTLSKGYRQRVGVAQAIVHKPEILVLDEPTNGLDPTQILAMRNLIKDLSKSTTVIISTHIMQEVEAICDRVLIVLNGKLALDASMAELQKGSMLHLSVNRKFADVSSMIKGISDVSHVEESGVAQGDVHHYLLQTENAAMEKVASVVAKRVVEQGWDLYRIHHEHRDLETVFKEVNRGNV